MLRQHRVGHELLRVFARQEHRVRLIERHVDVGAAALEGKNLRGLMQASPAQRRSGYYAGSKTEQESGAQVVE